MRYFTAEDANQAGDVSVFISIEMIRGNLVQPIMNLGSNMDHYSTALM